MKLRVALLAGAALLAMASTPALAQSGPYIGIGGGATWLEETDIKGAGAVNSIDFDMGWAGILKGGYAYGNGIRSELELGYRSWDVDSANGGATSGGDASMYTAFVNVLYDFMPSNTWSPYVGAGLGGARVNTDTRANAIRSDDNDTTWAAQGILGAWYALADNWLLSADYRYMYLGDTSFSTNTAGVTMDGGNQVHTVMLGLTYRFGAPAAKPAPAPMPVAAPAPAPAPAPAAPPPAPRAPETYIVFFAFDKSDISPVAAQVLDRAVADYRATGSTNVRIEGNADRSGKNDYNLKLSQRRADAVAAYLRTKGIAQNAIQTVANGEEKPRVPTADGVRNDENRNAQIYLRK